MTASDAPTPGPVHPEALHTNAGAHADAAAAPAAHPEAAHPEAMALRREQIAGRHLRPAAERPVSSARGIHHTALLCADVETTVRFYQDVLGFPLTHLFENRDYPGSTHFFFDVGNGNGLAFFDLPGLALGPYAEVLGGLHHLCLSVEPTSWQRLHDNLTAAGVEHGHESGTSVYFRDPDGARLEILSDPLGEMYGETVL